MRHILCAAVFAGVMDQSKSAWRPGIHVARREYRPTELSYALSQRQPEGDNIMTCGKHCYSVDLMVSWVSWGCAYQAKGVAFADGTKRDFGRRERPHMIFAPPADGAAAADAVGGATAEAAGAGASAPVPVALSTAVTAVPSSCTGHPCLWRYPDASYTLLQAISHQR
jgi:hypothetical protein